MSQLPWSTFHNLNIKMCSSEESLPLCLIVNFGSESEEVLVKEILFKGQKIVDNQSNESGRFTWEVDNKGGVIPIFNEIGI